MNPDFFINISIALIMLGIGLELRFQDFKRVIRQPRDIFTGLASQLLLLPLIAFIIASLAPVAPIYKVGIMLVAAVPGGTSSNLITHLLNGRTALSVSLTSVNSLIIIFTVPLIVNSSIHYFVDGSADVAMDLWRTVSQIGLTLLVPVLVGVIVNELTSDQFSEKIQTPLKVTLSFLMVLVLLLGMLGDKGVSIQRILDNIDLLIPLVILNLTGIITGYFFARWRLEDSASWYTIAIETGLQNSALAIFVASSLLANQDVKLIALLYASFSFFTTFGAGWLLKKWSSS